MTTTSSSDFESSLNCTSICVLLPTVTSSFVYPINEKRNTDLGPFTTIEYCPSTLVIVPLPFEFNSVTLAPGIGKPESSATTPFTTMSAIAVVAQNTATTNDIALSILPTI